MPSTAEDDAASPRLSLLLLGSGEFEPWTEELDRWALGRSRRPDGVALVAPAASAHEGDHVFDRWAHQGLAHYERLGVKAEVLELRSHEDAFEDDLIARLEGASVISFSGGNPARLAGILSGTPFWTALRAAVADGLPYMGCSAGVAALCDLAFDNESRRPGRMWKPGLSALSEVMVGPHWDAIDRWVPGASRFMLRAVPDGHTFMGIDERTAAIGDGERWQVVGRGRVQLRSPEGEWREFRAGDRFDLVTGPLR